MASSGSFNTGSYKGRYLTFSWWINSQSVANNTTTIGWNLKGAGDSGYVVVSEVKVTIDGSQAYYRSESNHQNVYVGTVVASGTKTITHNTDGSRSFSVSVGAGIYEWAINKSGSGSWSLTSIPRKATISSAPNFTDEGNPTITYSNPAGSAVTSLDACISFDGSNDDIPYRALSKSGTSYTFNLTDAERETLRNGTLSGSNTRTVKFYVRTVIGGNTFYSTLTKTLTIANATPTMSPTVVESSSNLIALTGSEDILIRYHSQAQYKFNATALKNATIQSYKVNNGTSSTYGVSSQGILDSIDANYFTFTVEDNRGLSVTKKVTKTLINYVHLTCNLEVDRPNALGEMTFKISGNYFNGSFGGTDNALTVYYSMEYEDGGISANTVVPTISGNTYSVEVPLTGLDYQKKYTFKAWAEDKLETADTKEITTHALPVFDWSAEDFQFNVPVTFNEGFVNEPKILWNGASHMNASQTQTLAEPISEQPNGVVLVFSGYDTSTSAAKDSSFNTFFVSKKQVELFPDCGHTFILGINAGFSGMAAKYIFFTDTTVYGHSGNTTSGTNSGITFNNSNYVLRYVIGV